jgi:hypothetical protein
VHVVVAALCHGIHERGDFGGSTPSERDALIAERLGPDSVRLLARYAAMQGDRATALPALLARDCSAVADDDRWSALIWVANEADDEIDAGSRFFRERPDRELRKELSVRLAQHFGWRRLGCVLAAAHAAHGAAGWAEAFASPHSASLTVASRGEKRRPDALRRLYWALRRR